MKRACWRDWDRRTFAGAGSVAVMAHGSSLKSPAYFLAGASCSAPAEAARWHVDILKAGSCFRRFQAGCGIIGVVVLHPRTDIRQNTTRQIGPHTTRRGTKALRWDRRCPAFAFSRLASAILKTTATFNRSPAEELHCAEPDRRSGWRLDSRGPPSHGQVTFLSPVDLRSKKRIRK